MQITVWVYFLKEAWAIWKESLSISITEYNYLFLFEFHLKEVNFL